MAENSNIAWTDHSWSPWRGCTKVSPGCANCYAEALALRAGLPRYAKGERRTRTVPESWKKPLRWNKQGKVCVECGTTVVNDGIAVDCECGQVGAIGLMRHPRVFFSLADPFDEEVSIEWLADYFKLIHDTPNLDWLLLTKRPENWFQRVQEARNFLTKGGCAETAIWLNDWLPTPATGGVYESGRQATCDWPAIDGEPPNNVWPGVTVENQEMVDKRIPELLKIPARVRFLSCEPLLEAIDLSMWLPDNGEDQDTTAYHNFKHPKDSIHWVIAGGESGGKRREMDVQWMISLWQQCAGAAVPFFCKQDSGLRPGQRGRIPDEIWETKEFPEGI